MCLAYTKFLNELLLPNFFIFTFILCLDSTIQVPCFNDLILAQKSPTFRTGIILFDPVNKVHSAEMLATVWTHDRVCWHLIASDAQNAVFLNDQLVSIMV